MGIFSQLSQEDEKRQQTKQAQPAHQPQRVAEYPNGRTPQRANGQESARGNVKRASFEVYPDQLKALKQFSLEDQLKGENGSMSAMVREALDKYILERNRRNGRTSE